VAASGTTEWWGNPVATRTTGSDRMRVSRERRRRGAVLVEIEVDSASLDRLIASGVLGPEQRGDRDAVAAAVLQRLRAENSSATGVHVFLGELADGLAEEVRQRRSPGRWLP
jgi:hypothetical protein